jgi:hypothetical protein
MVGVKITTSSYLHSFGESVLHDTQKIGKRFSPKVSSGAAMRVSISPTPTPFLVAVLVPSDVVVDAQCASHCCITVTALRNKEGAIGSDRSGDNRPLRDGRRGTIMCHRSTHDRIDGRCKQAKWLYFGLLLLTMLSLCLPTMEALAQTPVLYYTLNEGIIGQPSNGWTDTSGNGFNGFCPAGHCPYGGAGINGTTAASYQFTDEYIRVPTPNSILKPPSTVTLSAWIKSNSTTPDGGEILSMGDSYAMRLLNDGNLRFFFYVGSGVWSAVDTANLFLKDNAWHHVAGVKTSNALQVYVDGTLRNTLSNETRPISYTLGPDFWIGKHGNGFFNRYFIGTIEDARVYATPLSSSQIAALYSAGAAIRTDTPATLSTIADGPLTLENGSSSNYIPTRGGKATDPLFPGVTLMRVTDGTYSTGSNGAFCQHAYSYYHVFNANHTKMLLLCDNQLWLQNFNPATQTLDGPRYSLYTVMSSSIIDSYSDLLWSSVDPNILYVHKGRTLYAATIGRTQAGTWAEVTTFNFMPTSETIDQISKADFTRNSSSQLNDDVFAFTRRLVSGGASQGYVVWSKVQHQNTGNGLILNQNYTTHPLDEVRINKTGQYLLVTTQVQNPTEIMVNLTNNPPTSIFLTRTIPTGLSVITILGGHCGLVMRRATVALQ